MPKSDLLCSDGTIGFPPEILLQIAEAVIDFDPRAVLSLMLVSKSFNNLLNAYEKSITTSISRNDNRLAYVNVDQSKICSSRLGMQDHIATAHSYHWYSEIRSRSSTIDFLANHELTEMMELSNSWPTLDLPKVELSMRLDLFKRNAFQLLYRLADCAAGICLITDIRMRQAEYLKTFSEAELACLCCIIEVIGHGFFTFTKSSLMSSELGQALGNQILSHPATDIATGIYTPSSAPTHDLMNDNWIRECMCVFEDRVQRYGPYFAWAYLVGAQRVGVGRSDIWARNELLRGLDDMNAFELGYTMSYASLQSVVWRVFCKKVNCSQQDRWIAAKEIVENEMANYNIRV